MPTRSKKPRINRAEREFAFQCKAYGLPTPIPQFPFALSMGRKYTADFCFPIQRVLIEINGGVHMKGHSGHSSGAGIERDMEKLNYAARLKYTPLAFTPEQVMNCWAIKFTTIILHDRGWRSDELNDRQGTTGTIDIGVGSGA